MEPLAWLEARNVPQWVLIIMALGGLFKLGDVTLTWVKNKFPSEREKADTDAVAVSTLEKVLVNVLAQGGEKDSKLKELEARINKLEERERHMLTRAAIHEAWDQMAFQMLLSINHEHPPPPPLFDREVMGSGKHKVNGPDQEG